MSRNVSQPGGYRYGQPSSDLPARVPTTVETPTWNGLRFNIPNFHFDHISQFSPYLLNFTAEGYLNLLEGCYNKMLGLDYGVQSKLPRSIFIHNMVQLYVAQLIRIAEATRQQEMWADHFPRSEAYHIFNGEKVIMPVEVHDWLAGLGKYTNRSFSYWANVPSIIIPQARGTIGHNIVEGGDFGRPTAENHNAYETSIAPVVTRRLIEAQLANVQKGGYIVYDPLPHVLMPPNLVPTRNLLGYDNMCRPLLEEPRNAYASAANRWSIDDLGSRLGYNGFLWLKCNAVLATLSTKMKMSRCLPNLNQGSIPMYGVLVLEEGNASTMLRTSSRKIESRWHLDRGTVAEAPLKSYRRRRTEAAPGTCFVTPSGAVPAQWMQTINSSYNNVGPFQITKPPSLYEHDHP